MPAPRPRREDAAVRGAGAARRARVRIRKAEARSGTGPAPDVLVRDAHRAAGAIADETIAYLGELHPELLAGLPPRLDEVLRLAVRHASVRWICGVSDWWARRAQAAPDEDA